MFEETLNKFEASFNDRRTGRHYTVTFFEGEPVLYHPGHKSKPVLTHIATVGSDYFIADDSSTGRMIPIRHAQRTLKFKLTLSDVEREVEGNSLDPGERVLWRWHDEGSPTALGGRGCRRPRWRAGRRRRVSKTRGCAARRHD